MRYLLSLMVLFLFNTGQSQILLLMEDGVAGADTIPSQFTFADVTDAAVSSYNQGYIVVAGCDSARFYTNGTDSLKLGALGTYDVSEIWADVGDTVYMGNVASASNSTTTNKVLYSSNGTPLDTFSVTTVAGSGSSYTTAGLTYNFDWQTLTNGNVGNGDWVDSVTGTVAFNVDGTPVKGTDYITLGSGADFIYQGQVITNEALTIEMLVNITDTTDQQGIFGIMDVGASTHALGIKFRDPDDDIASLCVGVRNLNDSSFSKDVNYAPYVNKMTSIIVTWTGFANTGSINIYINGTLASQTSTYLGTYYDSWDGMILGYIAGAMNNALVKICRVYVGKVLTQGEIDANYSAIESMVDP